MRLPRKKKKYLKNQGLYQTKTELKNDMMEHNEIVKPRYERV